ncbi:hypothetical protein JR338_05600 [Chloroflexota bacterium]|nr:hypothetical protein JR338_05600 [Chloroflexota bacterium]
MTTLVISGCQKTPEAPSLTATPFTPGQATATPQPTQFPTATSPAAQATATSAPTQGGPVTVTQWDDLTLTNMSLLELAGKITPDNAAQVVPLAVWGNPRANTIAISADGQILAVGNDLGATLYDSISYAQIVQILTPYPVSMIAFSADNQYIAFGQQEGVIDIVSKADMTLLNRLNFDQPEDFLNKDIQLAFSPKSDSLLLMAQSAEQIHLIRWDTTTWYVSVNLTLQQGLAAYLSAELDLAGVIYNQPDLLLQSLSYTEESDLLDMPSSISPGFWNTFETYGAQVVPSSDGTFILINNGQSILSWEILSDEYDFLLDNYPKSIPDPCTQAPASCQNSSGVISWSCDSSQPIPPIGLIALTPDDVMVLISRNDGLTEFRSTTDTTVLWTIDVTYTNVTFSSGSEFFFGLRPDGIIEKRATQDGELINFIDQTPGELTDMVFSPDGTILAASYSDGWIRVYSISNGQLLGVLDGNASSLVFSRDGSLLTAGLANGGIRIFDLNNGSHTDLPSSHQAAVTALAFSSDGRQLIAGSDDCTSSLWQVDDSFRIRLLNPESQNPFQITGVAQNMDGSWFLTAGNQVDAVAFNRTDFTPSQFLENGPFTDLTLSTDDIYLAVAGEQVWVYPLTRNQFILDSIAITDENNGTGYQLAFNPTNSILAYVSEDNLSLWGVTEQETLSVVIYPLAGNFLGQPVSLDFSPYGNLIGLGMDNGLILIFGIPALGAE